LNRDDIIRQTRNYLGQQAELYGPDLYIDCETLATVQKRGGDPTAPALTLDEFREKIKDCQKCQLAKSRQQVVFGTGYQQADLMCIGEAPGHDEDVQGEPFVGAAGQLLNRILNAIDFSREEVYIANIIKCRPPGNRDPEPAEIRSCLPFLMQQIAMIEPKIILALGKVAAQTLLGKEEPLKLLRNKVQYLAEIPVIVTYHPAALLRNPEWKKNAWSDVQLMRKQYDQLVGDRPSLQKNNQ
jgi:DNA polymerase